MSALAIDFEYSNKAIQNNSAKFEVLQATVRASKLLANDPVSGGGPHLKDHLDGGLQLEVQPETGRAKRRQGEVGQFPEQELA